MDLTPTCHILPSAVEKSGTVDVNGSLSLDTNHIDDKPWETSIHSRWSTVWVLQDFASKDDHVNAENGK